MLEVLVKISNASKLCKMFTTEIKGIILPTFKYLLKFTFALPNFQMVYVQVMLVGTAENLLTQTSSISPSCWASKPLKTNGGSNGGRSYKSVKTHTRTHNTVIIIIIAGAQVSATCS